MLASSIVDAEAQGLEQLSLGSIVAPTMVERWWT